MIFHYSNLVISKSFNLGFNLCTPNTTNIVITPPKAIEGTNPSKRAATPDSNAPISLLLPIKILFTAAGTLISVRSFSTVI